MNQNSSSLFKTTLIAGLAIFLMFFGGGNLVFPISVGSQSGIGYMWATFGVFLTAVLVPLIGLLGIMRHNGDYESYFKSLGKTASLLIVFIVLSTLGPLGCIPRNVTVSFGGYQLLFPGSNLAIFSFIYCLAAAFFLFKWKSLVETLGKVFTPIFLLGVFGIVIAAIYSRPTFHEGYVVQNMEATDSFFLGLTKGYLTMDLLASFFFAGAAYTYLKSNINTQKDPKALIKAAVGASFISAAILTVIYAGFGAMGARYAQELLGLPPANYLPFLITHIFGQKALAIATAIIIVACFTTMIALVAAYAEFLSRGLFPAFGIKSMGYKKSVILTLIIGYAISLLGFSAICDISQGILDVLYPALIAYGILQLIVDTNQLKRSKFTFWGSLILSLAGKVYSL